MSRCVQILTTKEARMSEQPHTLTPEKHALYVHARQIMGRPGGVRRSGHRPSRRIG